MDTELDKTTKLLDEKLGKIGTVEQILDKEITDFNAIQERKISEAYSQLTDYEKSIDTHIKYADNTLSKTKERLIEDYRIKIEKKRKNINLTYNFFVIFLAVVAFMLAGIYPSEIARFVCTYLAFQAANCPLNQNIVSAVVITLFILSYFAFCQPLKEHVTKDLSLENFASLEQQIHQVQILRGEIPRLSEKKEESKSALKPLIRTLKDYSETAKDALGLFTPIYKRTKFVAQWENKCDEITNALRSFNLPVEDQIAVIKYNPTGDVQHIDDDIIWQEDIINRLSIITGWKPQVIQILVVQYRGENTINIWNEVKSDHTKLALLTEILYKSNRLDTNDITRPELIGLLGKADSFNLNRISSLVHLYKTVNGLLENYRNKLTENGIAVSVISPEALLLGMHANESIEENFYRLFSEQLRGVSELNGRDGHRIALLAALLHNDFNLRRKVLFDASQNDDAIIAIMAYQEVAKKKQEANKQFRLIDFLQDTEELEAQLTQLGKKDVGAMEKFSTLKAELSAGNWYDSPNLLLQQAFKNLEKKVEETLPQVTEYKIFKTLVDDNFKKININTVERAIHANLFSAYVILLKHEIKGGSLAGTVDQLSGWERKGKALILKSREVLNKTERDYGITLIESGKPKYNFVKYSDSARIGVIDRNTPFDKFAENLSADFNALKGSDKDNNIGGIAVIRITPSKYSFALLDSDLDLPNANRDKLEIARYITTLAADYLNQEEKATISYFDEDVDLLEVINQYSIPQLIEKTGLNLSNQDRTLLSKNELRATLFKELTTKLQIEVKTFRDSL